MKVLFLSFPSCLSIPNFATRLVLMSDHLGKGDDIYVLQCLGSIPKCYSNFCHLNSVCFRCQLNFDAGMKILGIPRKNIFTLKKEVSFSGIPYKFDSLCNLKKFTAYGVNFGFGVVSHLISELRDHKFDVGLYRDDIVNTLKSSILIYESVYELLRELKPNLLYIWNGRFFDVWPVIEACKKLEIDFYTYERCGGISIYKYTLIKNNLCHSLDWAKDDIESKWLGSDANSKEFGRRFYLDKIKGTDFFSLTKDQKEGVLPKGFDKNKRNVAIFSSSMDEYEAFEEYKNPIYKDENEGIKRILDTFNGREDIKFYLRVHPHLRGLKNAQIKELKKIDVLGYKNLKVIWPEEKIDSYALLQNCEKVVSFGSTMGIEACFWGVAAILIGRAYFEDLNCCHVPKDHDEVIKLIDSKLQPKPKDGAVKYGNWMMNLGFLFKKYKPSTLTTGTFLGKDIWSEVNFKDKVKLKFLVLKDFGIKKIFWEKVKKYKNKFSVLHKRKG